MHSLIVGILTALPSGAAVAIAILGENIGSLVGVAISASILPPAVNTVILHFRFLVSRDILITSYLQGIFWSMSVLHSLNAIDDETVIKSNYYSDHQSIELAIHGALSMLLTAANIACILFMGVLVLKVNRCGIFSYLILMHFPSDQRGRTDNHEKSSPILEARHQTSSRLQSNPSRRERRRIHAEIGRRNE